MKKLRPKDLLLLALALAGLAFAIPELAQRYIERRNNEIQGANIAASEAHAKILTTRFAADPRFTKVKFQGWSGDNGALLVTGEVATEAHRLELKQAVEVSRPPAAMSFMVEIPYTLPAEAQEPPPADASSGNK